MTWSRNGRRPAREKATPTTTTGYPFIGSFSILPEEIIVFRVSFVVSPSALEVVDWQTNEHEIHWLYLSRQKNTTWELFF